MAEVPVSTSPWLAVMVILLVAAAQCRSQDLLRRAAAVGWPDGRGPEALELTGTGTSG